MMSFSCHGVMLWLFAGWNQEGKRGDFIIPYIVSAGGTYEKVLSDFKRPEIVSAKKGSVFEKLKKKQEIKETWAVRGKRAVKNPAYRGFKRRRPDLNRCVLVLQTIALPLGYCAIYKMTPTGIEPVLPP